jgi:heme/copper-type cytochrome/quinol oxidase subunit 2
MPYVFALLLFIAVLFFGLSSMSQSYASAQQAQAAIEASRTAQIASAGNLVVIVTLAIVLLVAIAVIAYLLLHARRQPGQHRNSQPNTGQMPQTDMNSLLPAMLTMLLLQAMQKQNHPEADTLFRSRYEDDVALLEDEDAIPWMM